VKGIDQEALESVYWSVLALPSGGDQIADQASGFPRPSAPGSCRGRKAAFRSRGTEGSNPTRSSGESTNHRFRRDFRASRGLNLAYNV